MTLQQTLEYLGSQAAPRDSTPKGLEDWHGHGDTISFLISSASGDVPNYISGPGFFLYSLIVPIERLKGNYIEELRRWNFEPSGGYGHGYGHAEGGIRPFMSEPMEHVTPSLLEQTTPTFFLRSFVYRKRPPCHVEINQRVSHVLGIHWLEENEAWCRLSDTGDVINVARYHHDNDLMCCTLRREELDFYLFLADACLVRFFDVSRAPDIMRAMGAPRSEMEVCDPPNEIYASLLRLGDNNLRASFLRGFQILRCQKSRREMLLKLEGKEPRKYADFIILDWKNKRVIEWTSDPARHGNYFVKSPLPYQTSPAFFRPEVLLHPKEDPSRYVIEQRIIRCIGAWSLQYDINEEGQVSAYICHLSYLPYEEQLRWKSFNEEPKAGISARAFKTDFLGQWDDSYDPLFSLKQALREFPKEDKDGKLCPLWRMPKTPDTRDIDALSYVVTDSRKEWEDQIGALSQILIEGLNGQYINSCAEARGCRDAKLASGKQLARILEASGWAKEAIDEIMAPLAEAWDLRSRLVAHSGGSLPASDLKKHYRDLVQRCDRAMRRLAELVVSGFFAFPE